MQGLVQEGSLGEILFVDSIRINLGLVQPDVDVFWDLAPHDLAILDFVLPGGLNPAEVSAFGADPLGTGRDCEGHLNFKLPNDATAHVNVNWLSPTKIRQMVIGGSLRTLVWDDLNPQQRPSVYDRGVSLDRQAKSAGERKASAISYRLGDTWSPALPEREALGQVVEELASCIRTKREARTGGASGLRVLSVLEAVTHSLSMDGQAAPVAGYELAAAGAQLGRAL
jgi:predicted dehydrogenase